MEKYEQYFQENCTEDVEDVLTICETAGERLKDRFSMSLSNPETGKIEPKYVASCFGKIFEAIILKLQSLEKDYSKFEINILDRLLIGYTTTENEDDEKQGNFMIYIKHNTSNKKDEGVDDPTTTARERCVQWNAENVIVQPEIIKKIAINATKMLDEDIDIVLVDSECVMPIFIFVYESLVNYVKIRRREKGDFEFEINFMSCFFIGATESEDGKDTIYIRPNINAKLMLKNDGEATAKNE